MNIEQLIKKKNKLKISNIDLSIATGLSLDTISLIMLKEEKVLTNENLSKISKVLNNIEKDRKQSQYLYVQKEQEIKQLILNRYGSLSKFADIIGFNTSTLSRIFREGFSTATFEKMKIIFKELNLSLDTMESKEIQENKNNDILELLEKLNSKGIDRIKSYAEDLILIDKYKVEENE